MTFECTHRVDPNIFSILEQLMSSWRTKIVLQTPTGNIDTDSLPIRRGIFQCKSLSLLWFCFAMIPASHRFNSTNHNFVLKNNGKEIVRYNHLLYMDVSKLFELFLSIKNQHEEMPDIVEEFSNDISEQFSLDKCSVLKTIREQRQPKGRMVRTSR